MNAYINIYGDNPTAGASDGTLLSDGAACVFNLNTATLTSQTVRLAVRTAAADYFTTSLTISSSNPNNRFFKFAWNESDTFQDSISTTDKVSNANKNFYVKTQITDEGASIDTSCKITLTCKIPALYYLNMPLRSTGDFYCNMKSTQNFTIEVKLSTTSTRTQAVGTPRYWPGIIGYYDYSYYARDSDNCMALCSRNGYLAFWARNDINLAPADVKGYGFTSSGSKINDGNVHFVAAISDYGNVTLCKDGAQVGYKSGLNAVASDWYCVNYTDSSQSSTEFDMKLYEIRIWNRVLNPHELGASLTGNESNLMAWLVAGANDSMIVKAGNVSQAVWYDATSVCYEYITPSISADVIRNITGPAAHLCARVSDANVQIPLFEAACNPAVVCRVNNKNLYSPLVSVSDASASPIRIKVGGVVYALRR